MPNAALNGKHITHAVYEVAELFGEAYSKIVSVDRCVSGFRAVNFRPLNSDIFEKLGLSASDHPLSSI